MAIKYTWHAAVGSADGSSFANAYTTLKAAAEAAGTTAGDTHYVADDHVDPPTGAATTITFKGTAAAPDKVISVNRGTGLYSPGALVATTGASALTVQGVIWNDGVNFTAGNSTNAAILTLNTANFGARHSNCTLTCSNNSSSRLVPGPGIRFKNVTLAGNHVNNFPRASGLFEWFYSTPFSGTMPTYISDNGSSGLYRFRGCDLSAFTAKTFRQGLATSLSTIDLENCYFGTARPAIGTFLNRADYVRIINCSINDGKPMTEFHNMSGAATIDRTIYRTGGASDGTDPFSLKMVSTVDATRYYPCQSQDIHVNIPSTGSKTVTIHIVNGTGAGVTLNNDEIGAELQYLGTATSLGHSASYDENVILVAGAAQATSTEAWTTTGLTSPVYQKLEVTVTVNTAGLHTFRVNLFKTSTTVYVCPKAVIA